MKGTIPIIESQSKQNKEEERSKKKKKTIKIYVRKLKEERGQNKIKKGGKTKDERKKKNEEIVHI